MKEFKQSLTIIFIQTFHHPRQTFSCWLVVFRVLLNVLALLAFNLISTEGVIRDKIDEIEDNAQRR